MINRPLIAGLSLVLNFVTTAAHADDIKILCASGKSSASFNLGWDRLPDIR